MPVHSGGANLSPEEEKERPGRRSGRRDKESGAESGEEVGSGGRERRRGSRQFLVPKPEMLTLGKNPKASLIFGEI